MASGLLKPQGTGSAGGQQFRFEDGAAFFNGCAVHESDGGVELLHRLLVGDFLLRGLGLGDEPDVEDARRNERDFGERAGGEAGAFEPLALEPDLAGELGGQHAGLKGVAKGFYSQEASHTIKIRNAKLSRSGDGAGGDY